MPKLKRLSGGEVIKIFASFGFEVIARRGSHVKLRRVVPDGTKQTLTIPAHREIDTGTLKAIHRQALRYISDHELFPHFYSE
jgi:predicted RNA binding protein YcfA (HicA-like mRNA interferase family)